MNLTKDLIARIEKYRKTNKNPCKSYADEGRAERAAELAAAAICNSFTNNHAEAKKLIQWVVFYNPAWDRWCVAFNITKLLNAYGGYMGVASELGFYTYN